MFKYFRKRIPSMPLLLLSQTLNTRHVSNRSEWDEFVLYNKTDGNEKGVSRSKAFVGNEKENKYFYKFHYLPKSPLFWEYEKVRLLKLVKHSMVPKNEKIALSEAHLFNRSTKWFLWFHIWWHFLWLQVIQNNSNGCFVRPSGNPTISHEVA